MIAAISDIVAALANVLNFSMMPFRRTSTPMVHHFVHVITLT
jgi:hypothetical protein